MISGGGPITETEHALLLQGLSRMQLAKAAKDGSITIGQADKQFVTTAETIKATIKALSEMDPGQEELFTEGIKRKALRCCTGYLKTLIYNLTTTVLPEYDRRVSKASNDIILQNKFKGYQMAASDKLEVAMRLLNKLERAL
jgi:hypothetical protein